MLEEIITWFKGVSTWANENQGVLALIGIIVLIGTPFVVWFRKKGSSARRVGKYTIAPIIWIIKSVSSNLSSFITSGMNLLKTGYLQADFYLTRRGFKKMKLNLTAVPNVAETWNNPYFTSSLIKAGYLAAQLNKFMNPSDENTRNRSIQTLCSATPIVQEVLGNNTLDRDVFCALVAAYVIKNAPEYDGERPRSFPIPYRVIKEIIGDLFGREEEESQEADSES